MAGREKHILVTGGAGFIGGHFVSRALREGYDVTVVDNLHTGRMDNLSCLGADVPNLHFIHHNVQHPFPEAVRIRPPEKAFVYIIHLACPASPVHYQNDPIGTTLTCVNGTYNVLLLATQYNCPVFIASTSEVYGDPEVHPQPETYLGNVNCTGIRSCYDEGKRCSETLCFDFHRRFGTKIRVGRIFNTYGPRMCFNDGRIISTFLLQALTDADITIYGSGENTRSYQYVEDLVEAIWRFLHHPTEVGPINLGNTEELTVMQTAKMILEMVPGSKSKIVHLPATSDDPKERRPDNSKAQRVLNWLPKIGLVEGLTRTMEEFKERLRQRDA